MILRPRPVPRLDAAERKLFALGKMFRLLPTMADPVFMLTLPVSIDPMPVTVAPWSPDFYVPLPCLAGPHVLGGGASAIECADDPDDEDEDLGDEEDLSVTEPLADEESSFDDFDDEFDDDFEEEENDPDWDHPDDAESDEPPPAKGPGKKK